MSCLFDLLLAGGEIALRHDPERGVVASALLTDVGGVVAEGDGAGDIDTALDQLEDALPGGGGTLEQRVRRLGGSS